MSAFEVLRRAKAAFPEVVDELFLRRYLEEGLLSEEDMKKILED